MPFNPSHSAHPVGTASNAPLQWKWGTEGDLDAGHPYKDAAPELPATGPTFITQPLPQTVDEGQDATFTVEVDFGDGGGLWTPAEVATYFWLDAADDSTITESGSRISQWDDKSGNDRHLESSGSNQPLRVTDGVQSDDADRRMTNNGTLPLQARTVFLVTEDIGAQVDNTGYLGMNTGNGESDWSSDKAFTLNTATTSTISMASANYGGGFGNGPSCSVTVAGAASITDEIMCHTYGSLTAKMFQDGVEMDSATSTSGDYSATSGAGFGLGFRSGNSGLSPNTAALTTYKEVIYLAREVTEEERQLFEGYLAWKWGREANLPVGHPYKDAAPLVQPPEPEPTNPLWDDVVFQVSFEDGTVNSESIPTYTNGQSSGSLIGGTNSPNYSWYQTSGSYYTGWGLVYYPDDPNDLDFGTGDFCVEGYTTLDADISGFIALESAGQSYAVSMCTHFGTRFLINKTYGYMDVTNSEITLGRNSHFALVRKDGVITCYWRGVAISTAPMTEALVFEQIVLGGGWNSGIRRGMRGKVDDVRVTKGHAVYEADFTPIYGEAWPTTGEPAATDPNWDDVYSSWPMDGADASTTITDVSNTPVTTTAYGNTQIDTAESKFGGSSLKFDGSGDYTQTTQTAGEYNFLHNGLEDWTLDVWAYMPTGAGTGVIFETGGVATSQRGLGLLVLDTGAVDASIGRGTGGTHAARATSSTGLFTRDQYNFLRVTFTSATQTLEAHLGGVSIASAVGASLSASNNTQSPTMGRYVSGNSLFFNGWLDDFRLTRGVIRDGTEVPTAPFPTQGEPATDPNWDSVTLHVEADGGSIVDKSNVGRTITNNGATVSSGQTQYLAETILFDGVNDYLDVLDGNPLDPTQPHTITVRYRLAAGQAAALAGLYGSRVSNSHGPNLVGYTATPEVGAYGYDTGSNYQQLIGGTPAKETWHELEWGYDGTTHYLFLDGSLISSTTGWAYSQSTVQYVGTINASDNTKSNFLNGNIEQFQITEGVCRHTATYTPLAEALPTQGEPATDPDFPSVDSLHNFEDGLTTDVQGNTWTAAGSAALETVAPLYDTQSGNFQAAGDYIYYTPTTMPSGDVTFEFSIKLDTLFNYNGIFFQGTFGSNTNRNQLLAYADGKLEWYVVDGTPTLNLLSAAGAVTAGVKHDIRLVSESGTAHIMVDGVSVASGAHGSWPAGDIHLGYARASSATKAMDGVLDEFRYTTLSRGTATYTPALPFPTPASGSNSYQWYQDGAPVGDGTDTYVVTTDLSMDGDQVYVDATNADGTTSSDSVLLTVTPVIVGPTIDTQPETQSVDENTTATFNVAATTSGGTLSYQWYQNGLPVGTDSDTYAFTATLPMDGQSVYVDVSDDNGLNTSDVVFVNVAQVAPVIDTQPEDVLTGSGALVRFLVVASGSGVITYQWYDASDDSVLVGETADTFYLIPQAEDDGNTYYVIVTNEAGSIQSNTVSLSVLEVVTTLPRITRQQTTIHLRVVHRPTIVD